MALGTGLTAIAITCTLATGAFAQSSHDHVAMHSETSVQTSLIEPGQGAFATISEIVAVLVSDPNTHWESVDIEGLRQHLVDMDHLITLTEVEKSNIEHGSEFRINLSGKGGEAAGRMVPAHAPILAAETGWSSTVSRSADALILRVTDPRDAAVIRALGFYGVMSVGNHHRDHHLRLAKGEMSH